MKHANHTRIIRIILRFLWRISMKHSSYPVQRFTEARHVSFIDCNCGRSRYFVGSSAAMKKPLLARLHKFTNAENYAPSLCLSSSFVTWFATSYSTEVASWAAFEGTRSILGFTFKTLFFLINKAQHACLYILLSLIEASNWTSSAKYCKINRYGDLTTMPYYAYRCLHSPTV